MDNKFKTPYKDDVKEMLFRIKPDYKELPDNLIDLMISIYRLGWVECRDTIAKSLINEP